jgi:hypothetical protein
MFFEGQVSVENNGGFAHVINGEKGDLDCGKKPSKNKELRKTKTT